jgi:hypothetical protein
VRATHCPETLAGAGPRKLLAGSGGVKPACEPLGLTSTRGRPDGRGRSRLGHPVIGFVQALVLVGASGCGDRERSASTAQTPRPTPALRIVALTDLAGALEPCGCQSRPLGGMDKAAAKLAELRADKTPLLLVAAGDLWFGDVPEGALPGMDASTQERWKAETVIDILNRWGLAAAAPGRRDLRYGRAVFDQLAARAKFRVMPGSSAGAPAAADAPLTASWVTSVGGVRVGIVGASTAFATAELDNPQQRQLIAALSREAKSAREQGAQVVVGLLSMDQRAGRRLAGAIPELDFVVQGGLDSSDVPAPSRAGSAVILRAARNGEGMLVVDLYPRSGARFEDISAWTRREQTTSLTDRIHELDTKIRGWENDSTIDRSLVDQQRAKLLELRAEAKRLDSPPAPSSAAFDARFVELAPEVKPDSEIARLMDTFDARLNEHNRTAFASVRAPEAPVGTAHYEGADTCKSCHAPAYAWWKETQHGRAYTTLESRHKQFNLSCVSCHVTGYAKPGGAAIVQTQGLTHVGCESCHGAGSLHVADPDTEPARGMTKSPTVSVCKECHTPEHSDKFEFDTYVARLRAPGHGLPPKAQ